jgi:hypothetical protein
MCPKCGKLIGTVNIKDITVNAGINRNRWNGIAYMCPFCQAILSVAIDPIALKSDIVDEIIQKLKR